ncbi:hypothetical protein [Bacillus sp. V3-13]|uniref:hypothetical protein n=1 Tax=Bacillus sp. V3-13 TaxID=2053728 RepID=UPI002152CDAA|nr:hypothetical protein [Bacillus sp. V3-13]
MGAWGTGLWEDDLSCDIQDEWNELMDDGASPRKATTIILETTMKMKKISRQMNPFCSSLWLLCKCGIEL